MSSVWNRRTQLVTGVAALVLLAGCSSGESASSSSSSTGGSSSAVPSTEASTMSPAPAGTVAEGAYDGATVTFVSWGGDTQVAQVSALDGFAETSGAQVLDDGPTDLAKIQAQVESGQVTWDVVDGPDSWAITYCDTLFERIDYSIVDTSQMTPGATPADCGVPAIVSANVLAYNTEKYGSTPPTTWADFFDTQKFPGKRGIYSGNPSVTLEVALLADGVAPEDLYPLDVDRALRKLDTIKDDIVWWDGGAQVQQMMESGQIDMGLIWSGRAYGAVNAGAPWAVSPEQPYLTYDYLVIPKGTKNLAAANALINYYIGAEQQAKVTEAITYPGINKNAQPQLTETQRAFQVDQAPFTDQQYLDLDYWAENMSPLTDRWTTWVNG